MIIFKILINKLKQKIKLLSKFTKKILIKKYKKQNKNITKL